MQEQDYQEKLQEELNRFAERNVIVQAQLGHALNLSDWFQVADYLDEIGSLNKAMAKTFREAAGRRDQDAEPLEKIMFAVIYSEADFYNDRFLDKVEKIKEVGGTVSLFVKRGIHLPGGFMGWIRANVYYFDDTLHLNMLVSAFLSTRHWQVGNGDFVKVYGHGARTLKGIGK